MSTNNKQDYVQQQFRQLNKLKLTRELGNKDITEKEQERIELLLELEQLLNMRGLK